MQEEWIDNILKRISENLLRNTREHAADIIEEIQKDFAESNRKSIIAHILKKPSVMLAEDLQLQQQQHQSQVFVPQSTVDHGIVTPKWSTVCPDNILAWLTAAGPISPEEEPLVLWRQHYTSVRTRINKRLFLYNPVIVRLLDLWQKHGSHVRFIQPEELRFGQTDHGSSGKKGGNNSQSTPKLAHVHLQMPTSLRLSQFKNLLFVQSEKCRETLMHGWYASVVALFYHEFIKPWMSANSKSLQDVRGVVKPAKSVTNLPLIAPGQMKPSDALFNVAAVVMASQVVGCLHHSFQDYTSLFVYPQEERDRRPYNPFEPEKDLEGDWQAVKDYYLNVEGRQADLDSISEGITTNIVCDSIPNPNQGLRFSAQLMFDVKERQIYFDPPLKELETALMEGSGTLTGVLEMLPRVDAILYHDSVKNEEEMERAMIKAGMSLTVNTLVLILRSM